MSCHCGSLWIMEIDLGCVSHGAFLSGTGRSGCRVIVDHCGSWK